MYATCDTLAYVPPPRFPMLSPKLDARRPPVCRFYLENRCFKGNYCPLTHINPNHLFNSSGPLAVNGLRRDYSIGIKKNYGPKPLTNRHQSTKVSPLYHNDTSSDESTEDSGPTYSMKEQQAPSYNDASSDTWYASSAEVRRGFCPPNVCRAWCRGRCLRQPCHFLHIHHSHDPLIQTDPIATAQKSNKHPHPKSNEICWAWEHDWCTLEYDCKFVHGDLEYDSPVLDVVTLPDEEAPVKYPRPPNSAHCQNWLRGICRRGPACPYFHGDVNYEDPPDRSLPDQSPTNHIVHPRPQVNHTCIQWRRGLCKRGYDCKFVHEDLIYDDPIPDVHRSQTSHTQPSIEHPSSPPRHVPTVQIAPMEWNRTIHNYVTVKISAGFVVQGVTTGFETAWIFIDHLPLSVAEKDIMTLLSRFGTAEIKTVTRGSSSTSVKAKYNEYFDARNACASLDNTTHFGGVIRAQLSINRSASGGSLKDCTLRIHWNAPSLVGYGGYPTRERAQKAIDFARKPFRGYYVRARIHEGLPAVGMFTIQFHNLPMDVRKEDMKPFGDPLDMVWEPLSYTSVPDAASVIRRQLSRTVDIQSWDMTPPPYHDGIVRVFAQFATPSLASQAAAELHMRKPQCVGYTRVHAHHVKELSFKLSDVTYERMKSDILDWRKSLASQDSGEHFSGVNIAHRRDDCVFVKLFSDDYKELGRLKAHFEQMQRGQVVMYDGKAAWDAFFFHPSGKVFLDGLQRRYPGILVRSDTISRHIILHGPASIRTSAEKEVLSKIKDLRKHLSRIVPLPGNTIGTFMAAEFSQLKRELGEDVVTIDLWYRNVVVRGTLDQWLTTKRAVQRCVDIQLSTRRKAAAECPICFTEATAPFILRCGHTHCRSCLKEYLLAATDSNFFPLTCLGDGANCTELIPLGAAKEVLTANQFDGVVASAYSAYVAKRPDEFRSCPTPDCPQVYRPGAPGNILQCPACLARICSTCCSEEHDGMDCPTTDGRDLAFKDWKEKHDVKACPGCRVDIERAEGCNHVTCTRCQTHICWVCSRTFPRGEGIYDHMRAEHGGIGLVPHI